MQNDAKMMQRDTKIMKNDVKMMQHYTKMVLLLESVFLKVIQKWYYFQDHCF